MYPKVDFRVHINQLMYPKTCKQTAKKGKTKNSLSLSTEKIKNLDLTYNHQH
jgi:hypothetical protein